MSPGLLTKENKERLERVAQNLGFSKVEIVEARGDAGGLALMWTGDVLMECLWKTNRLICCSVKSEGSDFQWKLLGVYGTPYRTEKENFWNGLETIVRKWRESWLLMGDLMK